MKKRIKILTRGIIKVRGGRMNGPVLTPYFEDTDEIFKLISAGVKVIEVVDGEEVPLTVSNIHTDNSSASRKAKEAEELAKKEAEEKAKADAAKAEEERLLKEMEEQEKAEKEAEEKANAIVIDDMTDEVNVSEVETPMSYNNNNKHKKNKR